MGSRTITDRDLPGFSPERKSGARWHRAPLLPGGWRAWERVPGRQAASSSSFTLHLMQ